MGIESHVARMPASGFPGDDPSFGPATRLVQRVAASVNRPSIAVHFELGCAKKLRSGAIDVLEGTMVLSGWGRSTATRPR